MAAMYPSIVRKAELLATRCDYPTVGAGDWPTQGVTDKCGVCTAKRQL